MIHAATEMSLENTTAKKNEPETKSMCVSPLRGGWLRQKVKQGLPRMEGERE